MSNTTFSAAKRAWEKQFLTAALKEHDGNRSHTAEALGMSRRNLLNKISELGIRVKSTFHDGGER